MADASLVKYKYFPKDLRFRQGNFACEVRAIDDWTSDLGFRRKILGFRKKKIFDYFDIPIGEFADEKVHHIGGPLEEIHLVRKIT